MGSSNAADGYPAGQYMRILVITSDPRWVNAVRAAFADGHDVVTADPKQLASLLTLLPVIDGCFVAEAETGPFTVDVLKHLSASADVPIFAVTDALRAEWEEAALIAGARQVFKAPLRSGVVQLAVSRAVRQHSAPVAREGALRISEPAPAAPRDGRDLALWRDFSRLLAHGIGGGRFTQGYLSNLGEALGCSRLILYIRSSAAEAAFEIEAAVGIDPRQFQGFRVHVGHGVGRLLALRGGVLNRHRLRLDQADEVAAVREMTVFGAEIAVPLMSVEGCVGVLLVGPRIAGASYSDQEVTQIYHVMEAFAAAAVAKGDRVAAAAPAAEAFPSILHQLPIACAMVDESLQVLDANDAFRSQLGVAADRLPPTWSEAIAALRENRNPEASVELEHERSGVARHIRLSVRSCEDPTGSARRWLIVTDDITNETRLRNELHHRSVHNVLQRAGEQLSNEFRNALTPIEILVQLSGEADMRRDIDRLRAPVSMAVHRLRRRIDNLGYLTKASIVPESTTVSAVFRSARERLDNWLEPKQLKTLVWSGEFSRVTFTADTAAMGMAIAELAMNAVEAASGRQVTITADDLPEAVHFKVRNPGEWSPPSEDTGFGHRPFFTAKSAGVGLGVEVVSRVADHHGGRLVLGPIANDVVEAILRLPRNLPVVPTVVATPVTAAL